MPRGLVAWSAVTITGVLGGCITSHFVRVLGLERKDMTSNLNNNKEFKSEFENAPTRKSTDTKNKLELYFICYALQFEQQ